MTDIYNAPTNGHKIIRTSDGGLRINMPGRDYVAGHEPQTLLAGRVESLREYFRDERDKELGRWRSKKDPNFIVVQGNLEYGVTVIDERDGVKQWVTRGGGDGAERSFVAIAEEYFAEHPEKKPWHDAEQNDVWALQIKNCYPPELYRFAQDTTCADSKVFRPVNDPARVFFEANSPLIASAEKVWPQSKES